MSDDIEAPDDEAEFQEKKRDCLEIMNRIESAVRTMKLLPPVVARPKFSNWPPIIRGYWEAFNSEGERDRWYRVRIIPTARQISDMDEVCEWLSWLPEEHMKILWARGNNLSWRGIAFRVGLSPKTCKERAIEGVVMIWCYLKQDKHPIKKIPQIPQNLVD